MKIKSETTEIKNKKYNNEIILNSTVLGGNKIQSYNQMGTIKLEQTNQSR
jgi:hypothetical protein